MKSARIVLNKMNMVDKLLPKIIFCGQKIKFVIIYLQEKQIEVNVKKNNAAELQNGSATANKYVRLRKQKVK